MRWYWEPSHFKKELGDIVLQIVLNDRVGAPTVAGFGVRLTPASLEPHLAVTRAGDAAYRRQNPGPADWIAGLIAKDRQRPAIARR
jgi:hypothetical protein